MNPKKAEKKERKALWKKFRKEHYTIIAPDMLPITFELFINIVNRSGLNIVVIPPMGREAKDEGLRTVQNDACYPAIITTGQFITELKTGKYDLNKTAVIMSQTGGGCRASNYISLIRKALEKEFPTVPVLSINFSGLEKLFSIPLTFTELRMMLHAIMYGDMLMNLKDQAEPYHDKEKVQKALRDSMDTLISEIGHHSFYQTSKNYKMILNNFKGLEPDRENRKPRVGIVGEIYVKYSPYANNHLADFLVSQDCEVVYPSFGEFCLYCVYNNINDYRKYGQGKATVAAFRLAYKACLRATRKQAKAMAGSGFDPYEDFEYVLEQGKKVISDGVKMGEGWLIPAEMVAYVTGDVKNVVVVQPFGCLPNHIVGKGMIRPVKNLAPDANIIPLDFDASSTQVNQENRLKLMLANIKRGLFEQEE